MIRGNKGEWSEMYVFLKLLAEGKIHAADEELKKLKDIYFPIIKIIREENKGEINEYHVGEEIKIYLNGKEVDSLPSELFEKEANDLISSINKIDGKKAAFSVKKAEKFMEKINCYKLKAPSQEKADITIKIIDINTGFSPTVGFSIKSDLGQAPTLLNAGKTTNFTYNIIGLQEKNIEIINSMLNSKNSKDIKGRALKIENCGGVLEFNSMDNETFKDNLILIDSCMDKIIAQTLLYYYRDGLIECKDLVKKLEEENPLNYGNINAYSYKFKKFLTSVALGMKPATKWDGMDEANGGYIIVTKKGNVLAYHIYNRNYFEEYLLNNTKYETASTSRHGFGDVYIQDEKVFIKFNLQIRFI